MKHSLRAALVGALTFVPLPAVAQTPAQPPPQPSGPSVNLWYIGANTGVAVVEKTGGIVGGEAGFRVWKNLDLVGEIVWMQNVVTRAQLDKANTVASSSEHDRRASRRRRTWRCRRPTGAWAADGCSSR